MVMESDSELGDYETPGRVHVGAEESVLFPWNYP